MIILTLNCGSSSVKYSVFDTNDKKMLAKGIVERVGISGSFIKLEVPPNKKIQRDVTCTDHKTAIKYILDILVSPDGVLKKFEDVKAVGHRVVHGGEKFVTSALITPEIEKTIEELSPLAPLHNPPNLQGIRAAKAILPKVPHVAIFDTAFHQTMPPIAFRYAIPTKWYADSGIRRYGFHGTSHLYVSQRTIALLGNPSHSKVITAHLGNGVSMTAVIDGKSVDTSMGLTPLEGLVMGTRCGDIDGGIIFYMQRMGKLSSDDVDNLLNKQSGLKGLTDGSSDMRDIEDKAIKGDAKAKLALEIAAYRVRKYIGAYIAAMNGLDALVFTAGIGENSPIFRKMVCEQLTCFGIILNDATNKESFGGKAEKLISTSESKIKVYVIPTNEELVMAQDTERIMIKN